MKWMIVSDIHGSAFWCREMIRAFEMEKADRLLLLGDLLYHGPRNDLPQGYDPKAVAAMLNAVKNRIICVRGNCEAEVDQMMLEFPILAEYAILSEEKQMIFLSHGHHVHAEAMPPLMPGDILLYGHTHIPTCISVGKNYVLNPGSVSIPKEASPHSYMTLSSGLFVWKTLPELQVFRSWRVGDSIA